MKRNFLKEIQRDHHNKSKCVIKINQFVKKQKETFEFVNFQNKVTFSNTDYNKMQLL